MPRKRTKTQRPPLVFSELDSRVRAQDSMLRRVWSHALGDKNRIDDLLERVDRLERWMDHFANRRARRGAA